MRSIALLIFDADVSLESVGGSSVRTSETSSLAGLLSASLKITASIVDGARQQLQIGPASVRNRWARDDAPR